MTRWLTVSVVLIVLAFAGTLYVYADRADLLADPVPVHWNAQGQADKTVPQEAVLPYLVICPAAMAGMFLLTLVLPWFSPRPFSIVPFRGTYYYIMMLVVGLFAYIQAVIILASLKAPPVDTTKLIIGGVLLFFALLGNCLGKVRRNLYMGVRTPWTLADDTVWNQTHRLAAWLFTAGGLLGFIGVVAGVPFWWCLLALLVVVFVPVVYSAVLYKRLEKEGKLSPPAGPSQEVKV